MHKRNIYFFYNYLQKGLNINGSLAIWVNQILGLDKQAAAATSLTGQVLHQQSQLKLETVLFYAIYPNFLIQFVWFIVQMIC